VVSRRTCSCPFAIFARDFRHYAERQDSVPCKAVAGKMVVSSMESDMIESAADIGGTTLFEFFPLK